jgi:putative colanic acid biosysnthesis UDP-glucose lipid carrier transferase
MIYRNSLRKCSGFFVRILHVFDAVCVLLTLWGLTELYKLTWTPYLAVLALGSCALAFVVFYSAGLYRPWRGIRFYGELGVIVKSWVVCIGIVLLLLFVSKTSQHFSRRLLLTWFWVTPMVIFSMHMAGRLVLRKLRKMDFNLRTAVVVGGNHIGRQFVDGIQELPWAGIKIVGYFDDRIPMGTTVSREARVLGDTSELITFCEKNAVDYVYIALPLREQDRIFELVNKIRLCGAQVLLVPDVFSFSLLSAELVSVGDMPLVSFNPDFRWKRHFDIVFSFCALLVCSPLFIAIGLLIKMQDGGSVFYGHKRITATGKEFRCWKFRTMVKDADKKLQKILDTDPNASGEWQNGFKLKKDPRITRLGRFLRKTSLDELPQFFNVLKGDMSVVGARPVVFKELRDYYRESAGLYCSIKPGITGPWQVGKRNDIMDYDERVKADVWYIQNCSPLLDMKIIAETAWRVIRPNGAY